MHMATPFQSVRLPPQACVTGRTRQQRSGDTVEGMAAALALPHAQAGQLGKRQHCGAVRPRSMHCALRHRQWLSVPTARASVEPLHPLQI